MGNEEGCLPLLPIYLSHILSFRFPDAVKPKRGHWDCGMQNLDPHSHQTQSHRGEVTGQLALASAIPSTQPNWQDWLCLSQWEEALESPPLYPCWPQDP